MARKEIAPVDARTHDQLATRHRTIKTESGFTIDVHAHGVFMEVEGGDSLWLPRRIFDELITWYVGREIRRK